jgi:rRNA-processing protein FCF1
MDPDVRRSQPREPSTERRRLNPVIFDSSFLMAVSQKPTTWFEDMVGAIGRFDPVMLECVRRELERLAASSGARSRPARVALELGSMFQKAPCGGASVDDEITSAALGMKARVATADGKLATTLKSLRVGVITLRAGRVFLAR